ncbi:hypothetical protein MTR_7g057090 [Medicago truncatula]|uniref:F-box domain-containing protein n=1 Tax=Medicago truncatula TaxID=3880 RepID=G7L167_MEDTR|nr:hypothetical protein MTR_7g057090 [Medicago truncatula]
MNHQSLTIKIATESPAIFPEKLINMEVVSYLPVKTLMRFNCVSHSWKEFISTPSFVKLHLKRTVRTGVVGCCYKLTDKKLSVKLQPLQVGDGATTYDAHHCGRV